MATTQKMQQRMAELARQLAVEELGDIDDSDALSWLDAVESRAVEISDALAAELVKQRAALRAAQEHATTCPQCGKPGESRGQRERRLLTRRGPTTIVEVEYHCPCCRKAFFPDDPRARR